MGADGQPQIHMQAYSAMIDHGLDIQQALDMPRFLSGRFGLLEARDTLHIEAASRPRPSPSWSGAVTCSTAGATGTRSAGHANGITIDPVTGQRPAAPIRAATARRLVCSAMTQTRAKPS